MPVPTPGPGIADSEVPAYQQALRFLDVRLTVGAGQGEGDKQQSPEWHDAFDAWSGLYSLLDRYGCLPE